MKRYLPLLVLLVVTPLAAQPPAPPNPQAPVLNALPNAGAQRGTTADLVLTGTNLVDPTSVWTSFGGKVTISPDAKDRTPTSLKVKLEVPKEAPLGFHFVRLATKRGMSNARIFCIDDLPQVAEMPGNNEPAKAQAVPVPCVVIGRIDAEQTDHFKVSVKAGQRVSFEVIGRRLGSQLDPQITLSDAASGKELPNGFSQDEPGLQSDARLSMKFDKAGDVIIAVRDVSHRGGADFTYRLRIGDFPCATTSLPLAVKRGTKAKVTFAGPYVEGVAAVDVDVPKDGDAIQIAPKGASGLRGWPVTVSVSDLDEQLEKEPNDDPAKANRVTIPSAITGRFEATGDVDHYVFTAKKGQRVIIEAHTAEHGSPTDVHMKLKDAKGAQLQATTPAGQPRLDFTAGADGDYTISVEHEFSWSGPHEVYRLTLTPFRNDFNLTLAIDRFDVAPGGEVAVPIFLTRAGYAGPIEVSVKGMAGISGTVTIPAGPPKPPNVPSATLMLKAADIPSGAHDLRIVGKATVDGAVVEKAATVRTVLSAAMGNLALPPRTQFAQVGLAVTVKPPFTLAAKPAAPMAQPGKPLKVALTVTRMPDFKGDVVVALAAPVPGVTVPATKIAGAQTTLEATVNLAPNVKVGALVFTLQGSAKHDGRDWVVRAAPVTVTVKK